MHEDARSILMLDREPIRWQGPREHGLAWVEGDVWRRPTASAWEQASRAGACGLVVAGRRRFVHSEVSGLASVYWQDDGDATYFASRIDPLVEAAPGRLTVDWDAWAALLTLRFMLGERTPFEQVRRLGPFSVVRRSLRRGRSRSPSWPWAGIEPAVGVRAGTDRVLAALRESVAPLSGPVLCPLSGGRDSRLLLCLLAERDGVAPVTLTTSDDEGTEVEEEMAAAVAYAVGAPNERLRGQADEYPIDWEERARRIEYQFPDHPWLMPLARRVDGAGAPLSEGFGLDVLFGEGKRYFGRELLELGSRGGVAPPVALFDGLRSYGAPERALVEPLRGPLVDRAREQFLAAAAPFRGHRSQAILTFYATRTVRAVSTNPSGLFGRATRVLTPGSHDDVAAALLTVDPGEKIGGDLHRAVFERLAPRMGRLPIALDNMRPPYLPRRWRSQPALDAYRGWLAEGPLAPYVAPQLRGWLAEPDGSELSGQLRYGLDAIAMFHAWWRRYRHRLRDVDVRELL